MKLIIEILINLESISIFMNIKSIFIMLIKKQDKESDYFNIDWERNFLKNICIFEYKHMFLFFFFLFL